MSARAPSSPSGRAPGRAATGLRVALTAPVVLYQRVISPALPRRCKYEPTCSRYAVEALRRFGIARGLVLATWRLLRCNPWSYGGYDPLHAQSLFRSSPRMHEPLGAAEERPARGAGLSPPNPT